MYYFISDVHLGAGTKQESKATEERLVKWLRVVGEDATAIFLCGDIFDFWFEYKRVVPKGFIRPLAEIARLTDRGVRVVFVTGNHDMWVREYLAEECGVEIITTPSRHTLAGKRLFIAHGDNLNVKGDWKLTAINKIFRSHGAKVLFSAIIHPDLAMKFGHWWSAKSRCKHINDVGQNTIENRGVASIVEYAAQQQAIEPADYFIFGHFHQTLMHKVQDYAIVLTNDWRNDPTYAVLTPDGEMCLRRVNKLI